MASELEWCCEERAFAEDVGNFLYLPNRDGWVFSDGPMRRMTSMAAFLASTRGGDDHTGEPYVFQACPWCGADLPRPDEDDGG